MKLGEGIINRRGEGEGGLLINGGLTPLQTMNGYKVSAIQADKAL